MSIFNKTINFENLISFGVNGLTVANAQQVRQSLMDMYRSIYGQDIDLDDATADGQFTTEMAFILTKMLQALGYLNSNLKPSSASGQFLDTICSFNNIKRRSESNSTAKLLVKNTSGENPFAGIPSGNSHKLVFSDINGHTWVWEEVPYQTGNTYHYDHPFDTLDAQSIIEVTCEDAGPVNALKNDTIISGSSFTPNGDNNRGDINKCLTAPAILECWEITDAILGNYTETDEELRDRRMRESYGNGVSILEGLKSDLYQTGYIRDVYIVNNNKDTPKPLSDGTTVSAHNIYVIIRYIPVDESDIDEIVDNSEVGTIIYNDLTPGVSTTEFDGDAGKEVEINIIGNINQLIYWKQASPIIPLFTINFIYNKDFVKENFEDFIYDAINNYINDIPLGDDLHFADILTALNSVDNTANGKICFMATGGTFNGNQSKIETTYNYYTLPKKSSLLDPSDVTHSGYKFTITASSVTTTSLTGNGTITLAIQTV